LKASNKYLEEIAQTLLYFYRFYPDFFGFTVLKRTGTLHFWCSTVLDSSIKKIPVNISIKLSLRHWAKQCLFFGQGF